MYSSLITPKIANEHLDDSNWRFFDCRYVLTEPDKKQAEFAESHLPGATYAHVNHDLAAPQIQGKTGRHPTKNSGVEQNFFSMGDKFLDSSCGL